MNFLGSILSEESVVQESISIDSFYNDTLKSYAKTIVDMHSAFIKFQKGIFSKLTDDSSMSKAASTILLRKYKYYSDDIFGWMDSNCDKFAKVLIKYNTDTSSQVKIIKEILNKPGDNTKHSLPMFRVHTDIWFKTKAQFPDSKEITFLYSFGDLSSTHEWFENANSVKRRIERDKEVYITEGSYTVKDIIDLYEKYIDEVKKYWRDYVERIAKVRKVIRENHKRYEVYLHDKLQDKSEDEQNNEVKKCKEGIDCSVLLMEMTGVHYKEQMKIILQSMKDFRLVIQEIYDYIVG